MSCRLLGSIDSKVLSSRLGMMRVVRSSSFIKMLVSFSMFECVSTSNCWTFCKVLSCSSSRLSILSSRLQIRSMDKVIFCSVVANSLIELIGLVAWLVGLVVTV